MSLLATTTIQEAIAFAARAQAALYEARRPDLAELVCVVVRPNGRVSLSCVALVTDGDNDPTFRRAIEIDPDFEPADA